jgi:hypothetical protein
MLKGVVSMGFFKKFSAPKAKIELKLDEVAYDYKDKLTGRIVLDPQEDIAVNEFRIEFGGNKKIKWRKGLNSYNSNRSLEQIYKIPVGGPVQLQRGQHYEQPFQIDIPIYSRPDPFTELEVKVKGVAAVQGRPDSTNETKPVINFPYIIECLTEYGGCGFVSQPLSEPVKACPRCGKNLEEVWDRKYKSESMKGLSKAMGNNRDSGF